MIRNAGACHEMGMPIADMLRGYLGTADGPTAGKDLHVGDRVTVRYRRRGTEATRTFTAGDLPTSTATKVAVAQGLELVTVTPAIQAERGLRANRGALVVRITDDVRLSTGLMEGDVIIAINRTLVTRAEQVADLLEAARADQAFRITFERNGQPIFVDLVFR